MRTWQCARTRPIDVKPTGTVQIGAGPVDTDTQIDMGTSRTARNDPMMLVPRPDGSGTTGAPRCRSVRSVEW